MQEALATQIQFRDFIAIAALFVSIVALVVNLRANTKMARYRETISYIDKRDEGLRKQWQELQSTDLTPDERTEKIRTLLNQLNMVAHLLAKKAFDPELVYTHWWQLYYTPLKDPQVAGWVEGSRKSDKTVLQYYMGRCKEWRGRIEKELKGART
jgi:hypothetical protein